MKTTVWLNYHSEGWQPNDFDSAAEAVAFITGGHTHQPFRITRDAFLTINEMLGLEPREGEQP